VGGQLPHGAPGAGTGGDMPLYPMGASQGSATALGYTQSWTMSGGTSGELYISRTERRLLGAGMTKEKIAEEMGVSRATLYRWIEKFKLNESALRERESAG